MYIIHGKEAAGVEISRGRCARYKCSEAVRDITRAMTNSSSCTSAYLHMAPAKSVALLSIWLSAVLLPLPAAISPAHNKKWQQQHALSANTHTQLDLVAWPDLEAYP